MRQKERFDFSRADAIFDVRLDPKLKALPQFRTAMNHRDTRARAEKIKSCFGRGVLRPDHDNVLIPVRVSIRKIVRNVRQVFARHAETIGQIVVTGRNDQFGAMMHARLAKFGGRVDGEIAFVALDAIDFLIERGLDAVMLGRSAVILQRLRARGLAARARERQVADLHALGRGEEKHVRRVVVERIAQAAFVDHQRPQACALSLDGACKTGGPGPDADHVVDGFGGHCRDNFTLPRPGSARQDSWAGNERPTLRLCASRHFAQGSVLRNGLMEWQKPAGSIPRDLAAQNGELAGRDENRALESEAYSTASCKCLSD